MSKTVVMGDDVCVKGYGSLRGIESGSNITNAGYLSYSLKLSKGTLKIPLFCEIAFLIGKGLSIDV